MVFFQVASCLIKVELLNDKYTELRGEIGGPGDTPYEGGNFVLDIKIPETYPFNPPKVCKVMLHMYILHSMYITIHSSEIHDTYIFCITGLSFICI